MDDFKLAGRRGKADGGFGRSNLKTVFEYLLACSKASFNVPVKHYKEGGKCAFRDFPFTFIYVVSIRLPTIHPFDEAIESP